MMPRAALVSLCLGLWATAASAASFEFVPAPQADLNRMYRVDKVTGEVVSCQYGLQESGGGIGLTVCFGPGEGAGPQPPSEYGLVATRHTREAGVFRVNYRTGEMSICFVLVKKEQVVCTQQANPAADGAADGPPAGAAQGRAGAGATSTQGGRP
ncbi:hypothetical protein [Methylobacterium dankookense]|uniref:Uncharacterized protein n=1 Tax=Methylobacterium dankookense TaxID=560405 RepID=A0A564FXP6_9HYPH|nr:hypothetical protein [Methylobacterium dankookense]GJD55939.1 hypothetical protein IFDJLNFL_1831 [Methylobacterium dankookense]VUF12546.1 hypothetical protein MTDSW087_02238 [Methylobacterium dankookense]